MSFYVVLIFPESRVPFERIFLGKGGEWGRELGGTSDKSRLADVHVHGCFIIVFKF